MKKFYIVANPDKENTKNMQTAVEEYLTTRGAKVSAGKSASGHGNPYTDPEDVPGDTECVITLGGDGTLIQAARDLSALAAGEERDMKIYVPKAQNQG